MDKGACHQAWWPRTHMMEGKNRLLQKLLWLPHACHGICVHEISIISKIKICFSKHLLFLSLMWSYSHITEKQKLQEGFWHNATCRKENLRAGDVAQCRALVRPRVPSPAPQEEKRKLVFLAHFSKNCLSFLICLYFPLLGYTFQRPMLEGLGLYFSESKPNLVTRHKLRLKYKRIWIRVLSIASQSKI